MTVQLALVLALSAAAKEKKTKSVFNVNEQIKKKKSFFHSTKSISAIPKPITEEILIASNSNTTIQNCESKNDEKIFNLSRNKARERERDIELLYIRNLSKS